MEKQNLGFRPITHFAEEEGYPDVDKLAKEAADADALFDVAGVPHISVERWYEHIQKLARKELGKCSKSVKSLADTNQLGIINSNLKRLPESIRIKERKLRAKEALYKSATTDNEKYILGGEIGRLKEELQRHKENLMKAQERQKQILAQRTAELESLEAEDKRASAEASATDAEPSEEKP
jgi:predicted  nucleic acid-binding Zn-ribbon protein